MRLLLTFALAVPLFAQTVEDCQKHDHYGRRAEAKQCYQKLSARANNAARAEGLWGLRQFKDANAAFRLAVAAAPKNTNYRVRWGRLLLDGFNPKDASDLFQEALEIDPKNAQATLGLALVASDGFDSKAVGLANKALELDPKLTEAQELLASLALEDSTPDKAIVEAEKALKMSPESLDAMAILGTVDLLRDKKSTPWFDSMLKINPVYGEGYAIAGKFFVLNRRYVEGIEYYRKALALSPDDNASRAQLGVNLMRLGFEKEGREQLVNCFEAGYRNALVTNSLTLMDSYKNFLTFKTDNTIVKVHKKEADLIHPYVEAELKRAIATYEKKYKMKLSGPVQVEVYPDHEDFAVRTMGMPGLGALGVTFGNVVAMDSPSGRKPGTFHWASTLWHELSHVYVLSATNHRVPRWFTEGLAVHEETAAAPDWGDRLDPEAIRAIKEKKMLPIATLDRGFIRPTYPTQVVVSYFEAGRICDYIAKTWGYDKLLDMMHDFAGNVSTAEVVEKELGMKPEEFDKKFIVWLEAQTKTTVEGFDDWKKKIRLLAESAKTGSPDLVIKAGLLIRDVYPDYVETGSVYEFLYEAYMKKGEKANAMAQLEKYSSVGGRSSALIKKLATLQEEAGKKKEAAASLERLNYIYPFDEELHRRLGSLWLEQGNTKGAVAEFAAVIASKPLDQASSHFNLARALKSDNRIDDAKEQLLLALEAAPGYKPAQHLLLEMSGK
ncbi:MAG: tetratricopeptide repeat protein [Bryobacteraceae bacterium]